LISEEGNQNMKTIAIIGGGFCGTMTAVNLARLCDHPLRVVVINAKRPLGRGTAYGTGRPEHQLNVAARNMSALPDLPSHFLDWLRSRGEFNNTPDAELREMFAPRRVYGDYLRGLLGTCLAPIDARNNVNVESIDDEAVDVVIGDNGSAAVLLKSGESVDAEQVVLATGNQPPGSFPSASPLRHDPRYRSDPAGQEFKLRARLSSKTASSPNPRSRQPLSLNSNWSCPKKVDSVCLVGCMDFDAVLFVGCSGITNKGNLKCSPLCRHPSVAHALRPGVSD
jgi:uncharacterized NAD(P)/FAD-binding protein YdhS